VCSDAFDVRKWSGRDPGSTGFLLTQEVGWASKNSDIFGPTARANIRLVPY
jgi:hypothetical protein